MPSGINAWLSFLTFDLLNFACSARCFNDKHSSSSLQRAERADSLGMAGGHGLGLPFGDFLTFDLLIKIVIFASVSMPNILLVLRL